MGIIFFLDLVYFYFKSMKAIDGHWNECFRLNQQQQQQQQHWRHAVERRIRYGHFPCTSKKYK